MENRTLKRLESELKEKSLKYENEIMQNQILTKELNQWIRDHGDLLLQKEDSQQQLNHSVEACRNLREKLDMANLEIRNLKDEFGGKIRVSSNEMKMLEKQNKHLSEECEGLRREKVRFEEVMAEIRRREKVLLEKVSEAEKLRKENVEMSKKVAKLEREKSAVVIVATERFRVFEARLSRLERDVAVLGNDDSNSGSQVGEATHVMQEQESFGLEAKSGGLVGAQSEYLSTPIGEKTASSMPSPKAAGANCSKEQPESFESDTRPAGPVGTQSFCEAPAAEEKSATLKCIKKPQSASPFIVELSSSDDDGGGELPSPKGVKRKLRSSDVSNKREKDGSSSSKYRLKEQKDHSLEYIKHLSPLRRCGQKVGVASDDQSGYSKKNWDFEADILDDLQKDTELCMKGVCALYRHKKLYTSRETKLAKFLTNGDVEGGLKKALADLEGYEPKGADECRKVAIAHSKQLLEIYKNGKDPFFGPDGILG